MNKTATFLIQSVLFFAAIFFVMSFNDEFLSRLLPFEGELALLIFEFGLIAIGLHFLGEKMKGKNALSDNHAEKFNAGRVIKYVLIFGLIALSPFIFIFGMLYFADLMTSLGFK